MPFASASGRNSPGQQQPVLRVLPTHERLEPGDPSGRAAHDRQVVQPQLVAGDRRRRARRRRSWSTPAASLISMRAPPSALAWLPALIARRSTLSGRSSRWPASATPMLAVTSATPARTTDGWATPMAMRSASASRGRTVRHVAAHEHEPLAVHVGDDVTRAGDRAQSLRDRLDEMAHRRRSRAAPRRSRGCRAPPTRPRGDRGCTSPRVSHERSRSRSRTGMRAGAGSLPSPAPVAAPAARRGSGAGGDARTGRRIAGAVDEAGRTGGGGSATASALRRSRWRGSNPRRLGLERRRAPAPPRPASAARLADRLLDDRAARRPGCSTTASATGSRAPAGRGAGPPDRRRAGPAAPPARRRGGDHGHDGRERGDDRQELSTITCRSRGLRP